jgi:hypothetical protein
VYYDTLYKTFLFAPLEGVPVAFRGTVTGSAGKAAPWTEVTATANGVTYHTFTDAKGQYRLFGNITGPLSIQTASNKITISKIPAGGRVNLRSQ